MRYTTVLAVLMGLPLALAASLVSVDHASISLPADARLGKVSSPAPSPAAFPEASSSVPTTRVPTTAVNQSAVDVILGTPKATSFSPFTPSSGDLSNQAVAPSLAAIARLHASGDGSGGESCNGSAHGVDTADAGLAATQTFDKWHASKPSMTFVDYFLYRNRNATGSTTATRSPTLNFNLSDWVTPPAFADKNISDSHYASVTFPPPPAALRRYSKMFGKSFYDFNRGKASDMDDSGASFSGYDTVRIAALMLAQSALVVVM